MLKSNNEGNHNHNCVVKLVEMPHKLWPLGEQALTLIPCFKSPNPIISFLNSTNIPHTYTKLGYLRGHNKRFVGGLIWPLRGLTQKDEGTDTGCRFTLAITYALYN
jgi:hypothetical protein